MRRAIAVAALISACSGEETILSAADAEAAQPSLYVDGVDVALVGQAPAGLDRMHELMSAAATYWSGRIDALAGWTIVIADTDLVECPGATGSGRYVGCYRPETQRIYLATGGWKTLARTSLIHEVGHVWIGDVCHVDPRWMDFESVVDALWALGIDAEATWWRQVQTC